VIADRMDQMINGFAFVELPAFAPGFDTFVKLEGLNPAGSIKLKTARSIVRSLERRGLLRPGSRIVESTSGNLGVALAAIGAACGYCVTLVVDPNANKRSIAAMAAFGAEIVVVTERDANGGYLGSRIRRILAMVADDPDLVWPNQYANENNVNAHRDSTAEEILAGFGAPDWLFVGAGTTGTLMGCVKRFGPYRDRTRIVGVDAVGSVTFGGPAATRNIPGLGTSRVPEIFDASADFEPVMVAEADTIRMCRRIARTYGLLLGGSSGTVLAAVHQLRNRISPGQRVMVVSPDLGDRYLDTVYNDAWVIEHIGAEALDEQRDSVLGEGVLSA
jgi:2,3-diaminopropionate biosynthesis protein SbnA